MKIKFFTHACFAIEHEDTVVLSDPYINGTAFNDGWDLIFDDAVFEFDDRKKNFIYFSHEHPDHFSIPFLKQVSKYKRNNIEIFYQKTLDGRVKNFLRTLGYHVKEFKDKQRYKFAPGFAITIGKVPFYDSWALFEVGDKKILNVNDCVLATSGRVSDIKNVTGKVDIIFTQYSYADWVESGSQNNCLRKALEEERLRRIKIQSEALSPSFIVPFASMVRFCHVENNYMNDAINTPRQAVNFIRLNTSSQPYLMVPYEEWNGVDAKNNEEAMGFWDSAYKTALNRPLVSQKNAFNVNDLSVACDDMLERVSKNNNIFLINTLSRFGVLPEQNIKILDLGIAVNFTWHRGITEHTQIAAQTEFLEMTSESLHFLFSFDFGIDTLCVNSRFKGSLLAKRNLVRGFSILELNNTGRFLSFIGLLSILTKPDFIRQGLRTWRTGVTS